MTVFKASEEDGLIMTHNSNKAKRVCYKKNMLVIDLVDCSR